MPENRKERADKPSSEGTFEILANYLNISHEANRYVFRLASHRLQRMAIWIVALVIGILGVVMIILSSRHPGMPLADVYLNLGTEAIGIGITVGILETWLQWATRGEMEIMATLEDYEVRLAELSRLIESRLAATDSPAEAVGDRGAEGPY